MSHAGRHVRSDGGKTGQVGASIARVTHTHPDPSDDIGNFCWGWKEGGGGVYVGGYVFMLLHFSAIHVGLLDQKGMFATGTTTVISWFIGWCCLFYAKAIRGDSKRVSRALRCECLVLLTQLFVLAVGAGAFSRYYYGWLFGRERDIFQSLSIEYFSRSTFFPAPFMDWWRLSVTSRLSLPWMICEVADVAVHQGPFFLVLALVCFQPQLANIKDDINPTIILMALLIGPAQRFVWDFATCGSLVCDGPYHGFLKHIPQLEQLFWHAFPGVLFCLALLCVYGKRKLRLNRSKSFFSSTAGKYSGFKTIAALFIWCATQIVVVSTTASKDVV